MVSYLRPWETQKTFDVVIYFIKRYVGYFRNPLPPCKVDKLVQGELLYCPAPVVQKLDSALSNAGADLGGGGGAGGAHPPS